MKELENARHENFGSIYFFDDNFIVDKSLLRELLPRLKEFGMPYKAGGRAQNITPELAKKLAESGDKALFVGVESGSQYMHDLMSTGKNVERMAKGIINAKNAGMEVFVGIIIGFPGETWATIQESAENLAKMPLDSYNLFNFIPYPNTDAYKHPEKYGITHLSENWEEYFGIWGENQGGFAFEHKDFNHNDLRNWRSYMTEKLSRTTMPHYLYQKQK